MIAWTRRIIKRLYLETAHRRDRYLFRGSVFAEGLPPEYWDLEVTPQGHLAIQGCDSVLLAERYGTPLYVVDRARLEKNYRGFIDSFRAHYPQVEVGYSYKTNPLPGVLQTLHGLGASAEVISHFELWLALHLGVPPDRIIFNGPGKHPESLKLAVDKNIKLINIDGLAEIDIVAREARRLGRRQPVAVRLITSVGWSSQFGLSIRDGAAWAAFERIKSIPELTPCGLHIHLGTGLKDIATYQQAIRELLDFASALRERLGITMRYLDFGGGFGVPTVKPFSVLDVRLMANGLPPTALDPNAAPRLDAYSRSIASLVRHYYPDSLPERPTLIFEPGRAITSSAQSLLLQVLAIKPGVGSVPNVILDGGKNITMPLGYEYHEILPASRMRAPRAVRHNLFGPLCHPGDVVANYRMLPELQPGDVLAVMDAGAYFVPNQMNFSNPRPAAVMVHDGKHRLIRDRETFEDVVARDLL